MPNKSLKKLNFLQLLYFACHNIIYKFHVFLLLFVFALWMIAPTYFQACFLVKLCVTNVTFCTGTVTFKLTNLTELKNMLVQSSINVCFIIKLNRTLTKMSIFRCQHRQSTTRRTIQGEGYIQVHQRRRGRVIIWGGRNHFRDWIWRSGRTGKIGSLTSDETYQNTRNVAELVTWIAGGRLADGS